MVALTSLPKLSSDRAQNTYSALLIIKSKKLHIPGVVHSFMGGSDRTFTRNPTDNFRQPEETSDKNPATLHIISGNVYGKNRDMTTLFTLNETNTCLRLVQSGGES